MDKKTTQPSISKIKVISFIVFIVIFPLIFFYDGLSQNWNLIPPNKKDDMTMLIAFAVLGFIFLYFSDVMYWLTQKGVSKLYPWNLFGVKYNIWTFRIIGFICMIVPIIILLDIIF